MTSAVDQDDDVLQALLNMIWIRDKKIQSLQENIHGLLQTQHDLRMELSHHKALGQVYTIIHTPKDKNTKTDTKVKTDLEPGFVMDTSSVQLSGPWMESSGDFGKCDSGASIEDAEGVSQKLMQELQEEIQNICANKNAPPVPLFNPINMVTKDDYPKVRHSSSKLS